MIVPARKHALALAFTIALAPPPVLADEGDVLRAFQKCRGIADTAQRLGCYDAAAASAEALAKQMSERRKARSAEDFGLREEQLKAREVVAYEDSAERDEAVTSVTSEILEVWTDASRRRVFVFANGQVWRETSNSTFRGFVRPETAVEVRRGGIGGYRMTFSGRNGYIGVARVR
jgi:hypothetical protein